MENYITTTIILFTIATLIYELLLKNTTFFTTNRLYLIAIPVLLWFVPFINIETLNQEPEVIPIAPSTHVVSQMTFNKFQTTTEPKYQPPTPQAQTPEEPTVTFSWWWIYFAGAFISLFWFIKNYYQLSLLQSAGKECEKNGIKYYRICDSNVALSFLGKILIGEQIEEHQLDTILEHEQVHIVQNHHLDLLFFQVLNIVLWFNPFNYLFLNRLKLTHELLADAAVANQLGKQHYTELLLNKRFATSDIPFANMFFNIKTIKTRISMLYKDSSPKIASVRYFSLLLLLISAVVYTSCTTMKKEESDLDLQIAELNDRIKQLDSISVKDLESLENLQLAISNYSINKDSDFAQITSKDDVKIIDSIYRTLKAKDSIKLKAFNQPVTRKEYSEFMNWVTDNYKLEPIQKRQQPMVYLKRENGDEVIKTGFQLPRTKNCTAIDENEAQKCLVDDLSSFFIKEIDARLTARYTQYHCSISVDVDKNGTIKNAEDTFESNWPESMKGKDDISVNKILKSIKNKFPTLTPAIKNGEPVEVTIILPLDIRTEKSKPSLSSIALDTFDIPLYSEFKFGQKDFYKGISEEDSLWYNNYESDFGKLFENKIIDSTNAKQLAQEFGDYLKTKEGSRYFEISRKINFNSKTIVIDDTAKPKTIMTIIESPKGKVKYGTFPSQGETGLSDIKYEVFKHWAVQNYPSLKQTVVYSEGAIKDYYNGKYTE